MSLEGGGCRAWIARPDDLKPGRCKNGGKYSEDGELWCGIHAPSKRLELGAGARGQQAAFARQQLEADALLELEAAARQLVELGPGSGAAHAATVRLVAALALLDVARP